MSSVGSSVVSPVSVDVSVASLVDVSVVDVSVSLVVASVSLVDVVASVVVPSVVEVALVVVPSVASLDEEDSVVVLADMPDVDVMVVLLVPSVPAPLSVVVSSPPQLATPSATMIASRCGSGARECRICAAQNGQNEASTRSGREQAGHACMRGG